MQLKYNSPRQRFEFVCLRADKDTAKNAGFRWDPECFAWYANKYSRPWELAQYADDEAKAKLAELHADAPKPLSEAEKQQVLADSYSASADVCLPIPTGLEYLPFQKAGIAFSLARKNVLIADQPGLGKTVQAIGIINARPEVRKVLIVVPAALRLNWTREASKWLVRKLPIFRKDTQIEDAEGISIMSYEEATKYAESIKAQLWDMIIADEAHYLKNSKAKRTKTVLGFEATSWVLLTGTPVLNKPVEVFNLVKKIDPTGLGSNWIHFVTRYCDARKGRWGWETDGASNLDELNVKLRLAGMIRRTKEQVLTELPAKRRSLIPLEPDASTLKLIREQLAKQLEAKKAIRKARQLERKGNESFAGDITKLRATAGIAFEDISRIRHELARAKVPQVLEYVRDAVAASPTIVFGFHTDVIQAIADGLADFRVGKLTGEESEKQKNAVVDDFQAGKLDAIVCNIKAGGVGFTLTRSSHLIFAELDWTPGNVEQAEDRAHRIGQRDCLQVDWLVLDGSLEAKIAKTLANKKATITQATGDNLPPPAPASPSSPCPPRPPVTKPAEPISEEKLYSHPMAPDAPECPELPAEPEPAPVQHVVPQAQMPPATRGMSWKEEMEAAKKAIPKGIYIVDYHGKPTEFRVRVSRSSGCLYVERGPGPERQYMGFNREVLQILANTDLKAAGKKFADETGQCWKCGRPLTNELSILLGVGPECGAAEHAAHGG